MFTFSPLTNPPPFLSVYLYTIAMTSVADIFEDYVESKRMLMSSICFFLTHCILPGLQNLPSEIDQNMHELRSMDEEFQRIVYMCK